MRVVSCEVCGEDEDLRGQPQGVAIAVVCGRCGHTWLRDTTPACRRCGRSDLTAVNRAVWERARGEQLSIVGTSTVHLCPECDAAELDATDGGHRPRTPDEFGKGTHSPERPFLLRHGSHRTPRHPGRRPCREAMKKAVTVTTTQAGRHDLDSSS